MRRKYARQNAKGFRKSKSEILRFAKLIAKKESILNSFQGEKYENDEL